MVSPPRARALDVGSVVASRKQTRRVGAGRVHPWGTFRRARCGQTLWRVNRKMPLSCTVGYGRLSSAVRGRGRIHGAGLVTVRDKCAILYAQSVYCAIRSAECGLRRRVCTVYRPASDGDIRTRAGDVRRAPWVFTRPSHHACAVAPSSCHVVRAGGRRGPFCAFVRRAPFPFKLREGRAHRTRVRGAGSSRRPPLTPRSPPVLPCRNL